MKRKKKEKVLPKNTAPLPQKNIYDIVGISGEILNREPKIIITGDYLIEIYNHKGIVNLTETEIQINTRKFIYRIRGLNLMIATVTDDELVVTGTMLSMEKI